MVQRPSDLIDPYGHMGPADALAFDEEMTGYVLEEEAKAARDHKDLSTKDRIEMQKTPGMRDLDKFHKEHLSHGKS